MKRPLAVLLVGMGIVGIATCVGRRSAQERFAVAAAAVDADCKAFRSQPRNREANVCRYDRYGVQLIPLFAESKDLIARAESAAARGDKATAMRELDGAVATLDDMDRTGTAFGMLMRGSLVALMLDLAEKHHELDVLGLLSHVELATKHPFALQSLHHRWWLVHSNEIETDLDNPVPRRSVSDLADALEKEPAMYDAMDEALVTHHDVKACEAIAGGPDGGDLTMAQIMCVKLGMYLEVAARLDAARSRGGR